MVRFAIQQKILCEWIWNTNEKESRIDNLMNHIKLNYNFEESFLNDIEKKLKKNFLSKFTMYWNSCSRKKVNFTSKHSHFLDNLFEISSADELVSNISIGRQSLKRGRPAIGEASLAEASIRTKMRRLNNIVKQVQALQLPSEDVGEDHSSNNNNNNNIEIFEFNDENCDKTLAMYLDLKLSRNDYENLRLHTKKLCDKKLYPPYSYIQNAKKRCYIDEIEVTERKACVNLQNLLDHTTDRLLMSLDNNLLDRFRGKSLIFYFKWGMDGASSQQIVKQKWKNCNAEQGETFDESVFQVSVVPLQIKCGNNILWYNDRPSSVRYCRPIEFEFMKETSVNTMQKYKFYMEEIKKLKLYHPTALGRYSEITYDLKCTMIDGKTCNVLTEQAAFTRCNLCNASPNDMNDINYVQSLPIKKEFLSLGLHPLHCRIRFMEHILHVAYNLDFKEYYASGDINPTIKQAKKYLIQKTAKELLGLNLDIVKRGYGTTNDGNTSRRFFEKLDVISEVTGIDLSLLARYKTILEVLNSGYFIDVEKFKSYALDTAKLYTELYPWYPMPPSVHKVLIHGWEIIANFSLPIGCLSEEALECNNKIAKGARAENSRWCDRQKCNSDVLNYLLQSSDPYISSLRIKKEKEREEPSKEAKELLIEYEYEFETI